MHYTILAIHFARIDLPQYDNLREVITRIEKDAVIISQGVYVLHPVGHKELLEWATTQLEFQKRAFACVTTNPDQGQLPFCISPRTKEQDDIMDSWAKWET